jgi:hypothetical protein
MKNKRSLNLIHKKDVINLKDYPDLIDVSKEKKPNNQFLNKHIMPEHNSSSIQPEGAAHTNQINKAFKELYYMKFEVNPETLEEYFGLISELHNLTGLFIKDLERHLYSIQLRDAK